MSGRFEYCHAAQVIFATVHPRDASPILSKEIISRKRGAGDSFPRRLFL
jgi:hypothetical protein